MGGVLTLLERAVKILRAERRLLLKWAEQSQTQVEPMLERAKYLQEQILELKRKMSAL